MLAFPRIVRAHLRNLMCCTLGLGVACQSTEPGQALERDARVLAFASQFDQICTVEDPPDQCSAQFDGPNADPSCNTDAVALAAECTRDCLLPCGFNGLGVTSCNCAAGQFFTCECVRPDSYEGAPAAPYCDQVPDAEGSRSLSALDGKPCEEAFEQCVGDDPEFPRRNCACVPAVDPVTHRFTVPEQLSWACADLTSRWFRLQAP